MRQDPDTAPLEKAPAQPAFSPDVFDKAGLNDRLLGNVGLMKRLIETFLGDIPVRIEALGNHLETGNSKKAHLEAHTIKGSASYLGAGRLQNIASAIEKAAHTGDISAAKALLPELEMEFERLKIAMTSEVA